MTTKKVRVNMNPRIGSSDDGYIEVLYTKNLDGSYSPNVIDQSTDTPQGLTDTELRATAVPVSGSVDLRSDLKLGAKSLALTLSTGAGSVPIPDTATIVGVCPVSSTAIRIGLEAPEANGTKTGTAVAGDLKKGLPVLAAVWTWFNIGLGTGRTLYVAGGTSDVVEVAVS